MDEFTIPCPACGRPMVERVNSKNQSTFLGCTGWPDFCSHTSKMPAYVEVKRAGGIELPGFGEDA